MKIDTKSCIYPLSDELIAILEAEITIVELTAADDVTINFRDPNYSAKDGGFHPVEVFISAGGQVQYITDFAYVGMEGFAELVKEIDFDFGLNLFQHFGQEYPIMKGLQLFRLWQENFVMYYHMDVFKRFVSAC